MKNPFASLFRARDKPGRNEKTTDSVSSAATFYFGFSASGKSVTATTAIQMSNPDVREALDLSAEWDGLNNGSHLTMTCIAVRTAFAQEHPEAVENFLADYAASVEYVKGDPAAASELVAQYGITPKAKIAELEASKPRKDDGAEVEAAAPAQKICPICGAASDSKFCPQCGDPFNDNDVKK